MYKILFVTLFSMSFSVYAWDGNIRGIVKSIDVTDNNNYDFRVTLQDSSGVSKKSCSQTVTWSYINESDSNYSTYVSLLLAAKMAKNDVTIFTTKDSKGYCKIGYVVLH